MKKLLIISNNVLSETNNNGKTILSFVRDTENLSVAQIYFSGEVPKVGGYNYFRISDKDVIRGLFRHSRRGKVVHAETQKQGSDDFSIRKAVGRNDVTLAAREALWWKKWKSRGLVEWLDAYRPDAIFFVAGDTLFPYAICEYIKKRYNAPLSVYVTDDYIMPRPEETVLHGMRRRSIRKHMVKILKMASTFYTVSQLMRETYLRELHRDSMVAFNMSDDLYDNSVVKKEKEIVLTYTGSFYYGRANTLGRLALAIQDYNKKHPEASARLLLYSNTEPSDEIRKTICIPGASEYKGSLNQTQLRDRLNTSDILVFVESFEKDQIEKIRFSLSTKVSEYLSVEKPILAIGPSGTGSMDYLSDVAFCVTSEGDINSASELIQNKEYQEKSARKSREKYLKYHDKRTLQKEFLMNVLGTVD